MRSVLFDQVLDPAAGKRAPSGRISYGVLKYYLESGGVQDVSPVEMIAKSSNKVKASESGSVAGLPAETIQACKRAARKILAQCHSNIVEVAAKLDHLEEGLVNRDDLKRAVEAQRVSDLDRDELDALMKACDRTNKGYIATGKFIDQLYAFAAEGEGEAVLRRLAKAMQHTDTNLQQELARYDTTGKGKLDKLTFKRALRQLSVALSDAEIAKLLPGTSQGIRQSPTKD